MAARHHIQEVLIAIPSASGPEMTSILKHCHDAGLRCKTIPGLAELIESSHLAPQIRDVAVEDLLGRTPISLDESAIRAKFHDRIVMVTGAAGSIGSELCRQIARFRPLGIVAFDVAETPLFHLEQEMRAAFPRVPFCAEIGSIQDSVRLSEVLGTYSPSIVYHAAAYKHVPMMESALFQAVENNILGTANVAAAVAEHSIADFVMISSDKAVRPTNIMGLTKRVAELLIGSLQNGGTKFVSVRFGNVLGSNGSVIPIFKKQIATGGPVTITHPEMRRYFMTIPEAVQLVVQASTMGKGGEIFVLDMGQPVKILDLARNLILLSGLRPDHDIRIEFTGIRPGEKLYEELSTMEEDTVPTFHQKIKIFSGPAVPLEAMEERLHTLRRLCTARDARRLILELKDLVPEYNPSSQILHQLTDLPVPSSAAGPVYVARSA
jgi:FlaA1/EpsC-like NDP-sugar epimerase